MNTEEQVIGNLKSQFLRKGVRQQRLIGISPSQACGNISLAYYRGRAAEREDIIKSLKRKYPDAAKYLLYF